MVWTCDEDWVKKCMEYRLELKAEDRLEYRYYIYVNKAWAKFTHIFLSVLDSVAPLKEISIQQDSESCYNSDIHELIKKGNYYLISFRKT